MVSPAARRKVALHLLSAGFSRIRACRAVDLSRPASRACSQRAESWTEEQRQKQAELMMLMAEDIAEAVLFCLSRLKQALVASMQIPPLLGNFSLILPLQYLPIHCPAFESNLSSNPLTNPFVLEGIASSLIASHIVFKSSIEPLA